MLYGRGEERALLARLLERACDGHGGVLVIHGDAGVGTSTLLRDAAEHSSGMRMLHASGVESEVELPFATLHQLPRPGRFGARSGLPISSRTGS